MNTSHTQIIIRSQEYDGFGWALTEKTLDGKDWAVVSRESADMIQERSDRLAEVEEQLADSRTRHKKATKRVAEMVNKNKITAKARDTYKNLFTESHEKLAEAHAELRRIGAEYDKLTILNRNLTEDNERLKRARDEAQERNIQHARRIDDASIALRNHFGFDIRKSYKLDECIKEIAERLKAAEGMTEGRDKFLDAAYRSFAQSREEERARMYLTSLCRCQNAVSDVIGPKVGRDTVASVQELAERHKELMQENIRRQEGLARIRGILNAGRADLGLPFEEGQDAEALARRIVEHAKNLEQDRENLRWRGDAQDLVITKKNDYIADIRETIGLDRTDWRVDLLATLRELVAENERLNSLVDEAETRLLDLWCTSDVTNRFLGEHEKISMSDWLRGWAKAFGYSTNFGSDNYVTKAIVRKREDNGRYWGVRGSLSEN